MTGALTISNGVSNGKGGESRPTYDALYINSDNMAPDVPRGSIAFIEPPGWQGDGIYSLPFQGQHHGDLHRIYFSGSGYRLQIDNWPQHGEPRIVSREDLLSLGVRRVAGIAKAFTGEFAEFLRSVRP